MKKLPKGVAKRLIFSMVVLSAMGGCAVYAPPYPGPYVYGMDANGQPVYAAAPVNAVPYYYPYYYPNYYPNYYDPMYLGPPVFFNFGFHSGGSRSFHGGGGGFRGGGGGFRGGGRGSHGGGHR